MPQGRENEAALTGDLVELAERYGRYDCGKIGALLKVAGWLVNDKPVERIWRREGLRVPAKQPRPGRIWDNDGPGVRLRAQRRNHVWSYDWIADAPAFGLSRRARTTAASSGCSMSSTSLRTNVWPFGSLASSKATDVIDVLSDLFILCGVPEHIRSDNGPEFVAKVVQAWINGVGAKTACITPG